jgi:hypothetical protein
MARYAEGTEVSVSSSQQEIGRTLTRYQVETYSFGQRPGFAMVEFEISDLPIRVFVPLPEKRSGSYKAGNGRQVTFASKWEQEVKEAWRALALLIKANLEAVARGIISADKAFMAFLVLPDNGETMGERVLPAYRDALVNGSRLALPAASASKS